MYKRLMLTVQITHKMLGALGQAQQRLNADDLATVWYFWESRRR